MDPVYPLLQNSTAAHMACQRRRCVMEEWQWQQIQGYSTDGWLFTVFRSIIVSSHFN